MHPYFSERGLKSNQVQCIVSTKQFSQGNTRPYRTRFQPGKLWSLTSNTIQETLNAISTVNSNQHENPRNSMSTIRFQGCTPVIYREIWHWEGTHQENYGWKREKQLQAIDHKITKSITKYVLEVIQHLYENYGQVRHPKLNENEQSVKEIFYTLTEPLSTVFTKIEDIWMSAKAAKNQ